MKEIIVSALIFYVAVGSAAVFVTIYDKAAAKKRKRRIPEQLLFFWAAIGGALPMLITMKAINHKTRHKRFMLGLPAIILIHTLIVFVFIIASMT